MSSDLKGVAYLVITRDGSEDDRWLCKELSQRLSGVRMVTVEQLMSAEFFHSVTSSGSHWLAKFTDGLALNSKFLRGVVCSARSVPADLVAEIDGRDRQYAYQEISAALCSMLLAVEGAVVNRPVPLSLAGTEVGPAYWHKAARNCGIAVSFNGSKEETIEVAVVGQSVLTNSQISVVTRQKLERLSQLVPETAFTVQHLASSKEFVLVTGRPTVNYRAFGLAAVDALENVLVQR